jgi:hypothetical protein
MFWKKANLFLRGGLGNMEGRVLVNRGLWETYEGGLWNRSVSLWELCEGTWSEGIYWGNLKNLETVISSYRGPDGVSGRELVYRGRWKMK